MNAWQEYKKKLGETRPWDVVNPDQPKASKEEAGRRMTICNSCDRFIKITTQCRECGCIMRLKTTLEKATCPLQKW